MGAVDAPLAYGPYKTLCNRFVRSSRMGVFSRIFAALAGEAGAPDRLIIDRTHPRRIAARPASARGPLDRCIGRTPGRAEREARRRLRRPRPPRRHDALGRADERPEGRHHPPPAAAAGAGADRRPQLRQQPVPRRTRRARHHRLHPAEAEPQAIPAGKALYRQRHRIAIACARRNEWRRIATRDDRCATILFSAITLAAIVIARLGG
jgi:hypothetical protein